MIIVELEQTLRADGRRQTPPEVPITSYTCPLLAHFLHVLPSYTY